MTIRECFDTFSRQLAESLTLSAKDSQVVGFKSIVCYRTGLDVYPDSDLDEDYFKAILSWVNMYKERGSIRLNNKFTNDYVVRIALAIAGAHNKPGAFFTYFYRLSLLILASEMQSNSIQALGTTISP
jgi:hypothetical protein